MIEIQEINHNLDTVEQIHTARYVNIWGPAQSLSGKVLMAVVGVVIVGGFFVAIIVPLALATAKAAEENLVTTTTVSTSTMTSVTTFTTTTTTSTTSTGTTTSATTSTTSATSTSTTTSVTTSTTSTSSTTSKTTSTTSTTSTTPNPYACGNMTILYGYDLGGSDLNSTGGTSYTFCCNWCLSFSRCVGFTWGLLSGSYTGNCYLKYAIPAANANAGLSSAHY